MLTEMFIIFEGKDMLVNVLSSCNFVFNIVRKTENLCFAELPTDGFLYILQMFKIIMY